MSESKHTAGPWTYYVSRNSAGHHDIMPVASNGLGWVTLPDADPAGVGVYMQVGGICSEADARLIAAAPDLLEAAREVCAILDHHRAETGEEPCYDHEAIGEEVARLHDSLTAAIAKATGADQ